MTFMYCSVRPQLILCPVLFITRYYMDPVYRIQKKDLATNKFDKHGLWKKIFLKEIFKKVPHQSKLVHKRTLVNWIPPSLIFYDSQSVFLDVLE